MNYEKKELYTAKRDSGVDISDPAITEAFAQLKADSAETKFILLSLIGNSPKTQLIGSGADIEGLSSMLTDDNGYYGVVRASVDSKVKFFHLFFMGSDVGGKAFSCNVITMRTTLSHY